MRRIAFILAAVLIAASARAQPDALGAVAKREVLEALREALIRRAYAGGVDFSRWGSYLEAHRQEIDDAESTSEFGAAVNSTLRGFGVSHVAMIPPEAAKRMHRTVTIGIGADTRPAQGGLRVLPLDEGSAAREAGLQAGDIITHVDGKRAQQPEDLDGPSDSIAVLRVRRRTDGKTEELRVPRAVTEFRTPATLGELTSSTAIIRIPTFNTGYDPFEIEELIQQAFWYPNLVIDLRGNGGGRVSHLAHLLSMLVPEGTPIGTVVDNATAAKYVEATSGDPSDVMAVAAWVTDKQSGLPNPFGPYPGRLAVLIDGGSASASEVTTGALRETRNARVIGQKSAGALLVSTYVPLPHDFAVQIPFSDYVSIKGHRPEGVGIKPDIEARRTRRGEDPAAAAAITALEGL
ncbi:carboxyl-terminal processing protease [Phycisphaerales bacterium]|nr:carboxyl-terminal processing protease [Phycisphaerales bacterium]